MVLVVVWMLVLWLPRNRAYDAASTQARTAQSQVQALQSEYDRLKSEQAQLPQLQAQLAKMQAAIPDTPQLAQIFLNINDAAVKAGVTVTSIAPSPPAASVGGAAAPPAVKLSLALSGGYYQVLDFIDRLDSMPRLIVLDSVNISGGSSTNNALTVSIAARMFTTQVPATTPRPGTVGGGGVTTTTTAGGTASSTTSTTAAP